jgi:hypothetical protein
MFLYFPQAHRCHKHLVWVVGRGLCAYVRCHFVLLQQYCLQVWDSHPNKCNNLENLCSGFRNVPNYTSISICSECRSSSISYFLLMIPQKLRVMIVHGLFPAHLWAILILLISVVC